MQTLGISKEVCDLKRSVAESKLFYYIVQISWPEDVLANSTLVNLKNIKLFIIKIEEDFENRKEFVLTYQNNE